jgi:NTE family protein
MRWWKSRSRVLVPEVLAPSRDVFVLTGGGTRGAVQVGMLRALHEAGISPILMAGCSVGSLNTAWYAHDPSTEALDQLDLMWTDVHRNKVFAASRIDVVAGLLRRPYTVPSESLSQVIARLPVADISESIIPMRIITTRMDTGAPVAHSSGNPRQLLAASCAIPGVFPPVRLEDGAQHIDGGVSSLAPVFAVTEVSPTRIFVLDATGPVAVGDPRTALDVLRVGFRHAIRNQIHAVRMHPDTRVISVPDETYHGMDANDFSHSGRLIDAGYFAARAVLAAEAQTSSAAKN